MLKKPITYTNYNDVKVTEDHYFNLTQAELVELESSVKGGFINSMYQAIKDGNNPVVMSGIKKIIRMSYGEKSLDGKYFIKHKIIDGVRIELADLFEQTPAYSELFVELLTGDNASSEFIKAVMPADAAKSISSDVKEHIPEDVKAVLFAQE